MIVVMIDSRQGVRGSLDCHVDIDSLWMVHWEDRRNVETGSHTRVSDWKSVLCCVYPLVSALDSN